MVETFSRTLLPPGEFEADVQAPAGFRPRPVSGRAAGAIDHTAGGKVTARYGRIAIGRAEQHLYWLSLARQLNGGHAGVIVPIIVDLVAPEGTAAGGITHSDGTTFSDGTGYAQTGVTARLVGDHALNAGTLTFSLTAGSALSGGEWFSIRHPDRHWRAYRIWTIDEIDESGDLPVYTVGIAPPLRQAAAEDTELDFVNPRFLGQLAHGTTMAWRIAGAWRAEPSVTFVERFEIG